MKIHHRAAALALLAAAPLAQYVPPDLLVTEQLDGSLGVDVEPSRAVAIADVDGDGDLDVFVGNVDTTNSIYLNDGSGVFTKAGPSIGPVVTDVKNTRGLAAGDIDGDGDVDLFAANSLDQTNDLYVNQGFAQGGTLGTFVAETKGPVVNDVANSRKAHFHDVDGDGDLDLFVANFNNQDNFLYMNQGGVQGGVEGEFLAQTQGDAIADGATSYDCDFADVDGDGDDDLFVTNHDGVPAPSGGAVNHLYLNDGTGVFTRSMVGDVAVDVSNSLCCGFADFDGDGDPDLFVGNDEFDRNVVYVNDGAGVFTAITAGPLTVDRGESIGCAIGDVDLDGDLDLMMANRKGQPNVVYLNDGTGTFSFERQEFGPLVENRGDTYDVALGDLDGDLLPEILAVNRDDRNYTYWNRGRQWTNVGQALAGTSGEPKLGAKGNFVPGESFVLRIDDAAPVTPTFLVAGFTTIFLPVKGGVLVPAPQVQMNTGTSPIGTFFMKTDTPAGIPFGTEITVQAWLVDADGVQGFSATNALTVVTP